MREKAQLYYKGSEFGTPGGIKSVEESFNQMRKNDQEEFLKLHNHFLEQDLSSDQALINFQHQLKSTHIGADLILDSSLHFQLKIIKPLKYYLRLFSIVILGAESNSEVKLHLEWFPVGQK